MLCTKNEAIKCATFTIKNFSQNSEDLELFYFLFLITIIDVIS